MITTVIFDMDGVIVDTEPLHFEVSKSQFESLNITITPELYSTFTGNSNKTIYRKIKDRFDLNESVSDLIADKNKLFIEAFKNKADLQMIPGVTELISGLHDRGMQLIVASSSEHQIIDLVFERFGLDRYFRHKVSGADFAESKPHPDIFIKATALSGDRRENCIVIEDSANGIKAAKAADLYCIAYKGHDVHGQDQSLADEIVYDFCDLNFERIRAITP